MLRYTLGTFTGSLALCVTLTAPVAQANSWHWPHGGNFRGNSAHGSSSETCEDVRQLLDDRETHLSEMLEDLDAQLSGASGSERQHLIRQIRFLQARGNLLDVADRRLSNGRASDKKCALVEAFILRFFSYS